VELTPFHAKYYAYELTKRSASSSLQKLASALVDAQVDVNPHQVEAALFAFHSPLSKGAILADEVGLGKTIEAGLVISQKWAERKRKILIIVPANLRKQWYQELLDKFFLNSTILETSSFNRAIKFGNLNPFDRPDIIICSYQFAASKEPYLTHIKWDLVVIDEAHRLRNVYKPANKIANSIKKAVNHIPKLLLTATPLQNSLLELYGLVSVIDHYAFGDLKSFKSKYARLDNDENYEDIKKRLAPICKRTLRRQVNEYIKFTNRSAITQEFYPSIDEQTLYELVSNYLQRDKLYALPSSQRHLMTLILRKLLSSSTFAISDTLEALAKKLEGLVTEKKDVAADLFDDYESVDELIEEWENESIEPEFYERRTTEYDVKDYQNIRIEIEDLHKFSTLAKSITKNSKGEALLSSLQKGFSATARTGAAKKAVIFTESKRTQKYLLDILNESEYRGNVITFNGSNSDPESKRIYENWHARYEGTDRITGSRTADIRAAIVDFFKENATIMVATEAAAEGLNLQFCSLVVNYDLPWNPQRIEQRIGRCHRYGQQHDVVVVNFINKANAADQRVYEILDQKFKLFNGVFGASDEVLGAIESGVDFEKRIAEIYQNCRTTEEIQRSFDKLQAELEEKITDQMTKTRQNLLENFDAEVHEKLRLNLIRSNEFLSRYENWLWSISKYYLDSYAKFDDHKYSFTLLRNPFPGEQIHPGPYRIGKNIDDANIYRIGHPLAQKIIAGCKAFPNKYGHVIFKYSSTPQKISILESLLGKSGWLCAINFAISSFEDEDFIIFAGISDEGEILDQDQAKRLFTCHGEIKEGNKTIKFPRQRLDEIAGGLKQQILNDILVRNSSFFDAELEKLEKWADDLKTSLEIRLKEIDQEIKFRKTEAKKIVKLENKIEAQRKIKELEKRRNSMRLQLFESQDEIDARKEHLIEEIEGRIKQKVVEEELFTIRWTIQ